MFHKSTKSIILSLNHTYNKQIVICPIDIYDWPKTSKNFVNGMSKKGISQEHTLQLSDVLDNNYHRILEFGSNENDEETKDGAKKQIKEVYVRKYTGNGTLPLHESIVFKDAQPAFLYLDENKKPKYKTKMVRPGKVLYPAESIDSQNPLPYIFTSTEELEDYLKRATQETLDSLYFKVKTVFEKYVNAEKHHIVILAADTIYSYFQDKFPTLHYNIFVGDNGSGKNSALLVYRYLGYRVFYVVSASAANYFTFLGETEEGQGTIAEDEAGDIGDNKDKQSVLKTGYSTGGNVPKVDISSGRTQGSYLTYCMKWIAMEELPDIKKIKGILDRSFVYRFIIGDVVHNIKDVIKYGGDHNLKQLFDELIDLRKLLFAFRLIHYGDIIPDLKLNIRHRTEELSKPLLRLYSSLDDAHIAVNEIRLALSVFVAERNKLKKNSLESKLYDAVNNLISKRQENPNLVEYESLPDYGFYNKMIYEEAKIVMDGRDVPFKFGSFYSNDFGSLSHKVYH